MYVNGVLEGPALVQAPNGDRFEFVYVENKVHGQVRDSEPKL